MTQLVEYFPVNLTNEWHTTIPVNLSPYLINWLLDPGSLTARLKQHCRDFRVELLGQQVMTNHEVTANNEISAGEQVIVREVLLYCDQQPHVFARSLLPLKSLTGEQQQLADLGTQPLGQVLFSDPALKRSTIEVAAFDEHSSVMKLANQLGLRCNHLLWGRRSLFTLAQKPIAVAEVFLPQSYAYQQGCYHE